MTCKGNILFVTDNPEEAARFRQLTEKVAPEWRTVIAASPSLALEALNQQDFAAVFCDLMAGPLAGAQFLHDSWKQKPELVRFLLGHELDSDILVTCVLGAHQFQAKPLDENKVKQALDRVEIMHRLVRNPRIQSLVSRMRTLPGRPTVYLDLVKELRSSHPSPQAIGELVAKDLAISSKLLQVVNSCYYGLNQTVTDPGHAVMLLGMEATTSLVLSIEAFARFDKVKPMYFSMDKVWRHSQAVAQSARAIAEIGSSDPAVANDAFTAGLLHDIGKLALALNFQEQYEGALRLADKQNLPGWEVEQEVFGATHAETGAYLLSTWGMPFPIVEAVAGHHLPAKDVPKQFNALAALHLAETLEREKELAKSGAKQPVVDLDYPAELDIAPRLAMFRDFQGTIKPPKAQPAAPILQPDAAEPPPPAAPEPEPRVIAVNWRPSRRILLPLAAAIAVLGALVIFPRPTPQKSAARPTAPAAPAAKPPAAENQPEPPAEEFDLFAALKLQGILFNQTRSTAIINGKSARVGEQVEGAKILEILPNEVVLQKHGREARLVLK